MLWATFGNAIGQHQNPQWSAKGLVNQATGLVPFARPTVDRTASSTLHVPGREESHPCAPRGMMAMGQ